MWKKMAMVILFWSLSVDSDYIYLEKSVLNRLNSWKIKQVIKFLQKNPSGEEFNKFSSWSQDFCLALRTISSVKLFFILQDKCMLVDCWVMMWKKIDGYGDSVR